MSSVEQLGRDLKHLPPEKIVLCQVVDSQGNAWSTQYEFVDAPQTNYVQLRVFHPQLRRLPNTIAEVGVLTEAERLWSLEQRVKDLEGEFQRRGIEVDEWRRADQNCMCSCGKIYRDHPYGGPLTYEHSLILHRLCNGELVKL